MKLYMVAIGKHDLPSHKFDLKSNLQVAGNPEVGPEGYVGQAEAFGWEECSLLNFKNTL